MRTTITLDPDVAALVHKVMRERGLSFKEVLNDALRKALRFSDQRLSGTPTYAMGRPAISLDHALRVAAELDLAALSTEKSPDKPKLGKK